MKREPDSSSPVTRKIPMGEAAGCCFGEQIPEYAYNYYFDITVNSFYF